MSDSIPTRQSLLKRMKNWADHDSYQDFFNTYWKLIYSVARTAGLNDADAQDVVQETVLSVAKSIGQYETDPTRGKFKNFLLTITRRRIADQFRKRPPAPRPLAPNSDGTKHTSTAERVPDPAGLDWLGVWDEEWKRNLVEVAMERVKEQTSPKDWMLFHLQVVKEWPAGKVASKYSVSRAAAYMAKYRVSKAIEAEVRKMEKKWRES